jgi:hypothetical protein
MPIHLCTALFGVTPASLLVGRACCLADHPPVGLYDPDPETALKGALFLGLSARKDPDQLNPPEAPLRVAIVGHQQALDALQRLTPRDQPLLTILLFEGAVAGGQRACQAVPDEGGGEQAQAITAAMPELCFTLSGDENAKREGQAYLQALSPGFKFRQAL